MSRNLRRFAVLLVSAALRVSLDSALPLQYFFCSSTSLSRLSIRFHFYLRFSPSSSQRTSGFLPFPSHTFRRPLQKKHCHRFSRIHPFLLYDPSISSRQLTRSSISLHSDLSKSLSVPTLFCHDPGNLAGKTACLLSARIPNIRHGQGDKVLRPPRGPTHRFRGGAQKVSIFPCCPMRGSSPGRNQC